ncbi:hypothetical protein RN001_008371 [Aquatica leii]|uniref:Cytochrome P450 n=1 Tax=Aquatica leii TaxID=1421715 RepID=A0AAN7P452_9COLE|nr:hypothetical protein RN001_008371 [Aquatica leii]
MFLWLLCFFITLIGILVVWWYIEYFKYESYLSNFSGPKPLPIIGNLHHMKMNEKLVPTLSKYVAEHGGCVKFMVGFNPRIFIADAKMAEFVLSSNTIIKKSFDYRYLRMWLGRGLLTSYGDKWRKERKLLTAAFHSKVLEEFVEVFNKKGKLLIEKLKGDNTKEPIDFSTLASLYTLDVICETTMNLSPNALEYPKSDYVKSVKQICRIMTERIFTPKTFNLIFRLSKDYHIEKNSVAILHEFRNTVIQNRIKELANFKDEDFKTKKKVGFLDLMLTSTIDGNPVPHQTVQSQVDTFMFAGHDTTASGISFTLYALSKHQDIQDRVYAELLEVKEDVAELSYEHLLKMKYLDQVVKESLRMYPPVPIFSRILTEDVVYEDKVIPKNVALVVSSYHVHHNPLIHANPEVFDPERFSPENIKDMPVCAFIPFSAGPRNCIGQKFAMLEMKATICKILLMFKLLPVVEHQPIILADAVLTSQNGLPIRFVKRDQVD